jgi:hypothetical protein
MFLGCGIFCVQNIFAQLPTIKTTIDKNSILIGEHFHYKVETSMPDNTYRLSWFTMPDSIAHFQVVQQNKIDSSFANGNINFSQVITITSFDSGVQVIPRLVLNMATLQGDSSFNLLTDSVRIKVSYAPMDSVTTFHDIKSIIELKKEWPWWWWALLGLAVIMIALAAWLLIKFFRKKKADPELFQVKLSPYEEAMQSLTQLEQQQLLQKNQLKEFHTTLTKIFKRYISRKSNADKMYLTSGEIMMDLNEYNLKKEQIFSFGNSLRMGDAVKFAKYVPAQNESEQCFQQTKEMIISINQTMNLKPESAV